MITLTNEQSSILEAVVNASGHRILTGAAGCGKSVLIRELIKLGYQPLGATHRVAMAIDGKTVHSFLAAIPYYDSKGDLDFSMGGGSEETEIGLVVDESFMLNRQCVQLLMRYENVVFVGDKNQIPPVGEHESHLLEADLPIYELQTCMRFGSKISDIAKQVLDAEDMADLAAAYQAVPRTEIDFDSTFLSYKNETVKQNWLSYCQAKNRPVEFIPNDQIIVKPSYWLTRDEGLVNGDTLEVIRFKRGEDHNVITARLPGAGANTTLCTPTPKTLAEIRRVKEDVASIPTSTSKTFFHALKPYGYLSYVTPANTTTVHKAQGASISKVTVSKDILSCRNFKLAKALLYTAITRAKDEVMRN